AKLFGVEKLEYHERNVAYDAVDKEYSYEKSLQLIYKVFNNLDKTFSTILQNFVENEQIDVYPKKGKTDGAFCAHFLKKQPVYILLNHTNNLRDVTTLAHELGHGINDELMKLEQHALNFDTTLSTAEVASTFMEDFVLQELMHDADEETALSICMTKLNDDISTIFRQVACYSFEQELHKVFRETGFVSKETIGKLFQKHMAAYMGECVEQSAGSENWWVYWGHIRRYFYNYSYAMGLLISKALQRNVKTDKNFIENVKQFLSAGTSQSPQDIFKAMNIDISQKSFWDEGIKEIETLLTETEKLANKLGKI
ncbi:MAG: M3 family metallopeptidase, partial [Nanoarchaeota archaeon]